MFGLFKKKDPKAFPPRPLPYYMDPENIHTWRNFLLALTGLWCDSRNGKANAKLKNPGYYDVLGFAREGSEQHVVMSEKYSEFDMEFIEEMTREHLLGPSNVEWLLFKYADKLDTATDIKFDSEDEDYDIEKKLVRMLKYDDDFGSARELNFHLFTLCELMSAIRFAVVSGKMSEEDGWRQMETLGEEIAPHLARLDSWADFAQQLRFAVRAKQPSLLDIQPLEFEVASQVLLNDPESPWNQLPFHFTEQMQRYHVSKPRFKVKIVTPDDGLTEEQLGWQERIKNGEIRPFLEEIARRRNATPPADGPLWALATPDLVAAVDAEAFPEQCPELADAWAYRSTWYELWAYQARGSGSADEVGEENFRLMNERLAKAFRDRLKSIELNPEIPGYYARLLQLVPPLNTDEAADAGDMAYQVFEERFPNDYTCQNAILFFKAQKWGGSHEESYAFARQCIERAGPASVAGLLLFETVYEHWFWFDNFEEDEDGSKRNALTANPELNAELDAQFEILMRNWNKDPDNIGLRCSYWFKERGDGVQLARIAGRMDPEIHSGGSWGQTYRALSMAGYMNWLPHMALWQSDGWRKAKEG
ncbi:hypothetical protein MNBD_GAMMA12-1509 [hydrothermal vent metagenome]|uniref:DUF4034 domain-containing protein n=1 Tax=hydrothermal vent metagenome TaxID=652676 RepID=A0A3B0YK75_9ZZZZ